MIESADSVEDIPQSLVELIAELDGQASEMMRETGIRPNRIVIRRSEMERYGISVGDEIAGMTVIDPMRYV